MEVFVHSRGKDVELVQLDASATAQELVESLGMPDAEASLEGEENPLSADVRLEDAGVLDRANIHVGTCKKVSVSVRYQTSTKTYDVPASATLQSVFARAAGHDGFDLSEVDRAKYTLQVQDTTNQPELSRHLGSFVDDDCSAAFDLVLQDRFQG